jgi:iron complex transport system ATP-binding protein
LKTKKKNAAPPTAVPMEICILAGGLSSRMGRDKSSLRLGQETFLQKLCKTAQLLTPNIRVIQEDIVERCGPLGGILTALKSSKAEGILFLACDMPLVTPAFLGKIFSLYRRVPYPIFTMERGSAGFPFLLPRSALPVVEEQIEGKEFSLQKLCARLHAAKIEPTPEELRSLINVNRPEEYLHLKQQVSARPSRPVLEIKDLAIRRGKVDILSDFNWRIQKGEHWVILGPNGSGKTSLLSTLLGYMTPTAGTIRFLDEEFGQCDWRALRKEIGIVSSSVRQMMPDHEPALITVASGRHALIDFWGEPSRSDQIKARKILRQVQCEYVAERPWAWLSQGERQRVLIARSLMADPKLLILDEPCAGLDPVAREQFLRLLDWLGRSKNPPALVLVTHHVEEIMPVFTHLLLLEKGRSCGQGPIADLLNSENLSRAFTNTVVLKRSQSRFYLEFP